MKKFATCLASAGIICAVSLSPAAASAGSRARQDTVGTFCGTSTRSRTPPTMPWTKRATWMAGSAHSRRRSSSTRTATRSRSTTSLTTGSPASGVSQGDPHRGAPGGELRQIAARPAAWGSSIARTLIGMRVRPDSGAGSGGQRNTSASTCDGVLKPRVCRGRPLSLSAMASKSAWVKVRKSRVLGRY
jgi:hypothetical protein